VIDAVLSYHANGHTCGVAKFNQRLAQELGVPCLSLDWYHDIHCPLISVMSCEDPNDWPDLAMQYEPYELFLHDVPANDLDTTHALGFARRIYAANGEIRAWLAHGNYQPIESFCPATITGNPSRGRIDVLTFGMAHKIQASRYERLKTLLDATGQPYTVSLSTAIHEGKPWDFTTAADQLRAIFGDRLRYLGYLADDALAKALEDCTAVALFYDPALRANNTTAWAAVDARKALVTNLDAYSPHGVGLDIEAMREWVDLYRWFDKPDRVVPEHSWAALVEQIRQPVAV
jgi:hypothetical protein